MDLSIYYDIIEYVKLIANILSVIATIINALKKRLTVSFSCVRLIIT